MELWIRSQDKMTLANVYSLYTIERDFAKNDSIWWEIYCNDEISLGLYLKDRAEEVLDEIQNILKPQEYEIEKGNGYYTKSTNISIYVYEMPKE